MGAEFAENRYRNRIYVAVLCHESLDPVGITAIRFG